MRGRTTGRERRLSFAAGETEKTVAVRGDGAGEEEPPRLRLIPSSPGYTLSTCLARDVRIIGKVVVGRAAGVNTRHRHSKGLEPSP